MAIRTLGTSHSPPSTRVTPRVLSELTRRLVRETKPDQIILFGSYAYGKPHRYSDLDLMIVTQDPLGATDSERRSFVYSKTSDALRDLCKIDFDVLTLTPDELMERLELGHPLDREIVLKGQILYARRGSPRRYHAKRWRNRMPDSQVVKAWIERADADYHESLLILRRRTRPQPPFVCFHCQQAVEKYLKAFLLKTRGKFQHTHKLEELNAQCAEVDSTFLMIEEWVKPPTDYVISGRYPNKSITMKEASAAVATLKQVRKFIAPKLDLKYKSPPS